MPTGNPILTQLINDTEHPGHRITLERAIYRTMRETGLNAYRAAATHGIHRDTVWRWLNTGRKAQRRKDQGAILTQPEERARRFFDGSIAAHADWVEAQQRLHDELARGGYTATETLLEVDPTQTEVGPDGQARPKVLRRTVKSKTTLPDLRAIEWQLERLARSGDPERNHEADAPPVDDYAARLEVTGAEGGPVEVGGLAEDARRLAAEARAFAQGVEDGRAREREQVADEDNAAP